MRFLFAFGFLFFFAVPVHAYQDAFDGLLKDHVKPVTKDGVLYNGIDYDAWADDARHVVVRDAILAVDPAGLETRNETLAYWINAYNFLTVDLIVKEGERESIKNLGRVLSSPWKSHDWKIAGEAYTLDDIEHEIIRPMGEARIHFAINCAAKSCPDLRMEAYRADRLEVQLADQTQLTFKNPTKGFMDFSDQNAVRVSKVMDWFGEDFNNGDVRAWLQPYFPDLINDETKIRFFNYDWSLNAQ